jgi:hypothetical protein
LDVVELTLKLDASPLSEMMITPMLFLDHPSGHYRTPNMINNGGWILVTERFDWCSMTNTKVLLLSESKLR